MWFRDPIQSRDGARWSATLEAGSPVDGGRDLTGQLVDRGCGGRPICTWQSAALRYPMVAAFRTLLMESWTFSNWLTHAKVSTWYDAEAAASTVEHAHVRAVPEACPACGSNRLSPERGYHSNVPDIEWERPTCENADGLARRSRSLAIRMRTRPKRKIGRRRKVNALSRRCRCARFVNRQDKGTELALIPGSRVTSPSTPIFAVEGSADFL
jgi:hypothetical protein